MHVGAGVREGFSQGGRGQREDASGGNSQWKGPAPPSRLVCLAMPAPIPSEGSAIGGPPGDKAKLLCLLTARLCQRHGEASQTGGQAAALRGSGLAGRQVVSLWKPGLGLDRCRRGAQRLMPHLRGSPWHLPLWRRGRNSWEVGVPSRGSPGPGLGDGDLTTSPLQHRTVCLSLGGVDPPPALLFLSFIEIEMHGPYNAAH